MLTDIYVLFIFAFHWKQFSAVIFGNLYSNNCICMSDSLIGDDVIFIYYINYTFFLQFIILFVNM